MTGKKKSTGKASKPKSSTSKARKNVVVTVDDAHLPKLAQVAKSLRARGMKVDDVADALGLISGSVAGDNADLRSVPGVAGVDEQPQFQVPPPDSPVQ